MRKTIIAGNWKMYKTRGDAVAFVKELRPLVANVTHCDVVVAPPFTALAEAAQAARGSGIGVAAQDVHWDTEGAHTGGFFTISSSPAAKRRAVYEPGGGFSCRERMTSKSLS